MGDVVLGNTVSGPKQLKQVRISVVDDTQHGEASVLHKLVWTYRTNIASTEEVQGINAKTDEPQHQWKWSLRALECRARTACWVWSMLS